MNKTDLHNSLGIPKGYFDSLEERILAEIQVVESEKFIQEKFGRNTGFIIPNDYWIKLDSDILTVTEPTKVFQIRNVLKYASIAALFVAGVFIWNSINSSNIADVPFEKQLAEADLHSDDILDFYSSEDLSELVTEVELDEIEEDVLDYLLDDENMLEDLADEINDILL